jgi:hypothetical protein
MNFKEWLHWFRTMPWVKKWFVILILIRPITDNFYDLKEVSVLTSPLYIIGILTPILILMSLTSSKLRPAVKSNIDVPFYIWGSFVIINCLYFYFTDLSLVALGDTIKYSLPILLFAYTRRFVQGRTDLLGVLQTFLYASIFPFGLLLYETIFNPIAIEYMAGRGGGSRIRGGYGDIMNYAIYTIGSIMIIFYYFISKSNTVEFWKDKSLQWLQNRWFWAKSMSPAWVAAGFIWGLFVLSSIKHVSTWGNFLMIVGMLFLFNLRNFKGILIVLAFSTIFVPFFAQDIYNNMLQPLIEKEINAVSGDGEIETLGNGRMTRWEKYFEVWEKMSFSNHMFGVSFSGFPEAPVMMGLGMHSDYIRNLFLSGIIGILFYVLFMIAILAKAFTLKVFADKYLALCSVFTVLLYSLSTMPTLYAPFLYLLYSIYSFTILPNERQH